VRKLIVFGGGAVLAVSASALLGTGVAAAVPDGVVGQTYADASTALDDAGDTGKVAVTVGGRLSQDECIVTNAWDAPFVRDTNWAGFFEHASGEVLLSLNCNGTYASATNAGPSVASTEGRSARAAAEEAAAEEAAAAQQSEEAELAAAGDTPGEPGAH
jgi:hypothetical protein